MRRRHRSIPPTSSNRSGLAEEGRSGVSWRTTRSPTAPSSAARSSAPRTRSAQKNPTRSSSALSAAGWTRGHARNAARSSAFLTLPLWYTRRLGALPPPMRRHPPLPPTTGRNGYTSWPPRGLWGRRVLPNTSATGPRSAAFRDAIERRLPELLRRLHSVDVK